MFMRVHDGSQSVFRLSMKTFGFLLLLVISAAVAVPAQSRVTPAHIQAHVNNCVEKDSDGVEIKTCFLNVVRVNANGEFNFHNSFIDSLYPDSNGDIAANLPAGTYRLVLFTAHSPGKSVWTRIVNISPGRRVDLGKINASPPAKK